jgi:hypothetical protein
MFVTVKREGKKIKVDVSEKDCPLYSYGRLADGGEEMKDITKLSDEELINFIDDGDNQDIFDEIRRRLKEAENMKCCGNCDHRGYIEGKLHSREYCRKNGKVYFIYHNCDQWQLDYMTRENII